MNDLENIAKETVDSAFRIHSALGPGLLESVYEVLLAKTLMKKGFHVERQKPIAIEFDGAKFDEGFRADLIVNRILIVELKSVENLSPVHAKQLLTYLKLMNLPLGLLINFGSGTIKSGIKRVVNNYNPNAQI